VIEHQYSNERGSVVSKGMCGERESEKRGNWGGGVLL